MSALNSNPGPALAPTCVLVTGGAGFIGSNFVLHWLATTPGRVLNLDKLTYAANPMNLEGLKGDERYAFIQGDIQDKVVWERIFREFRPQAVVHFAAESHVDRSIHAPAEFIRTNINGTYELLAAAKEYWRGLPEEARRGFRVLHISTDEVFGSLSGDDPPFSESTPYRPSSPYSASKAASDHLVRAFHQTYGLPVITTNCTNNYGPFQFPEKLIPLMILNAMSGKQLPVYGDGKNVRDWLYVGDHVEALAEVLRRGKVGETYCIGGKCERSNLDVVRNVCSLLDEMKPRPKPYADNISFVTDRPGHDRRYAMSTAKIEQELGWRPRETFESGLRKTVRWYLDHAEWVEKVVSGSYREWMALNYEARGAKCEA